MSHFGHLSKNSAIIFHTCWPAILICCVDFLSYSNLYQPQKLLSIPELDAGLPDIGAVLPPHDGAINPVDNLQPLGIQGGVPGMSPIGDNSHWGSELYSAGSSDLRELFPIVAFIAMAGVFMFVFMYCRRGRPKRKKPHRLKTRTHTTSSGGSTTVGGAWGPVIPRVPSV